MTAKQFGPIVRHERLSDRIAAAILQSVDEAELRPGDLLPTESDLSAQFEVSRTAVREAMRSLSGKGVITTGPGRRLMVATADPSTASESLSRFIQASTGLDYRRVHEVRAAIEVETAGLAAERAKADNLASLRDACDGMERALPGNEAASRWDFAFHRAIAASTQNDLFVVMIDAISDPLMQIRRMTFGPGGRARDALESHREILARVIERDAVGARRAMLTHLTDVATFWEQHALTSAPSRWFPDRGDATANTGGS